MNKETIKKILIISLTNIGDIILTLPVVDILKRDFPAADLSIVVGPKGEDMLKGNPVYKHVYVFNKKEFGPGMLRWLCELKRQRFDLVVDLRNSAIPFLISARHRTSPFMKRNPRQHMRYQHLNRLKSIHPFQGEPPAQVALEISQADKDVVDNIMRTELKGDCRFVVVGPGAADSKKQWTREGFAFVCDSLIEQHKLNIVFIGDDKDTLAVREVRQRMRHGSIDLSGELSLLQLAYLLKKSIFTFVNDSAPLHMASYFDVPVLAVFGPTDPAAYGPWSKIHCALKHDDFCPACHNKGQGYHTCMKTVQSQSVLSAIQITPEGVRFNTAGNHER